MRFFSRGLAGCLLLTLLIFSAVRLVRAEQSRAAARENLALLEETARTLSEENARLCRYKTREREDALQYMARNELALVGSDEEIYVFRSDMK